MISVKTRPGLRCYMNLGTMEGLGNFPNKSLALIREAGYQGVQFILPPSAEMLREARSMGLGVCGSGRVNVPGEAEFLARQARDENLECLTLHVGWGIEDDDNCARLIEDVLNASAKYEIPLYPETHRATIFQDIWRTVQFVNRFPQLRFNGDFSHWYTGSEFIYGGFERKFEFLRPVMERVRFLHGRIGNPGCIQVDIGDGESTRHPYVQHFRELWTAVFSSFLANEPNLDFFCFAPELLPATIYYARTCNGQEESDRWQQSLVLARIAQECFKDAQVKTRSTDDVLGNLEISPSTSSGNFN